VQLLRPLDRQHAAGGNLVEAEISDLARIVESIQIDVIQRQPAAAVFLHQRERRAADLFARNAEALGQPLHERGLAGTEIAVQQHDVPSRQLVGEFAAGSNGVGFPGARHRSHSRMVPPYTERMRTRVLAFTLLLAAASAAPSAQTPPAAASSLVERVEDTGFIQIQAPSFASLDARQQTLAYWLTQASIAIDPIIYDQLSQYGLREKRLLEGIVGHSGGIQPGPLQKIRRFALLFWANRGNHNEITGEKFLPTFTAAELESAALAAQKDG